MKSRVEQILNLSILSSSMPSKPMPVVALGCYRDVAETTNSIFAGTLYYIAAVLDLYSSPPPFAYTKQTLGATLHTLSPRPKVFITGAGITPEMSAEAIGVWEEYVGIVGLKALEVHVINVSFVMLSQISHCDC